MQLSEYTHLIRPLKLMYHNFGPGPEVWSKTAHSSPYIIRIRLTSPLGFTYQCKMITILCLNSLIDQNLHWGPILGDMGPPKWSEIELVCLRQIQGLKTIYTTFQPIWGFLGGPKSQIYVKKWANPSSSAPLIADRLLLDLTTPL